MPGCIRAVSLALALLISLPALATSSSLQDEVQAAYRKLRSGDTDGAQRDVTRLIAANPGQLSPRFALLQVLAARSREDRALEPEFERQLDGLLRDADARYRRSSADDEALFYLANAHMLRAAYRTSRHKGLWGAARDGARAKRLAEAYIARHPEHGDAYLALGAYNYYVALAPALVRVVRILLFLPPGNREEGLRQIERASTQGNILSFAAGLLLMEIYGTYEGRPSDGVRIGERLARAYPDNPEVPFQLAELYLSPAVEDFPKAAEQYRSVIAREERRGGAARPALYRARLGLASSLVQQWRLDDALALLTPTIEARPAEPKWVLAEFLLRRANYRALKNDPGARDDVGRVLAEPRWKDQHKSADELLEWMDARRASGEAAVYASLLPGNRLVAERRWDEAAAAYEAVRRQHPVDPVVRYRMAVLRFMRGEAEAAAPEFAAVAGDRRASDPIRAQALLYLARAHDLAGRRTQAKKTYEQIVDDYEQENAAWAARVGLVSPYQRH